MAIFSAPRNVFSSSEEMYFPASRLTFGCFSIADNVTYNPAALKMLKKIEDMGYGHFPVCMAKTQYSLSDDQTKLGRPTGFDINIREVYVSAGAGFVVVITGAIMTMPGLPKKPAADRIDVTEDGIITGLF